MRLALILVFIVFHVGFVARCDEGLEQQLAVAADSSAYTVQLASFIPLSDLSASETLQIAFISTRLCGKGFANANGQVNRVLLQDVTELTSFETTSYYYFSVTKAAAALPAPVLYVNVTGRMSGLTSASSRCRAIACHKQMQVW